MKTQYQYIHFAEVETKVEGFKTPKRKTKIWTCWNTSGSLPLGTVQWYGPWRQYCFYPADGTIFNKGCLSDIQEFLSNAMAERQRSKS